MESLIKQIRLARRRLLVQQFAGSLAWCWFVALLVAAVAVAASRVWFFGVDGWTWSMSWVAGALGTGVVAAGIWTWSRRKSTFEAAVEIDRRFNLRERVSSSLALTPEELETEAGQALVTDAAKRVDRIQVGDGFQIKLDRRAWLPLLPAAAAFALAIFVDSKGQENPAAATTTPQAQQVQVKKSAEALRKQLAERKREAHEKGLEDAEGLFKKIEDGAKNLANKDRVEQKQALMKLNDLSKDLEKRRRNLTNSDNFKQQLNDLKNVARGPADKIAQALKNGDLKDAKDELAKLQKQLNEGALDDQVKQELAKQLEQMQQKLDGARQAHEQAKRELQKQIQQKQSAGDTEGADKLQQQLDKLCEQGKRQSKLGEMAQQLKQAADAIKQGNTAEASQSLDELSEQIASLQKEQDELQMLDDALDQIADAKSAMKCDQCEGQGCEHCQGGQGHKQGGKPQGRDGEQHGQPGRGIGKGSAPLGGGKGDDSKTKFYESTVKQTVGKGSGIIAGEVEGPNRKGEAQDAIKAQFESAKSEAADPLTGQRLPRDYREHAKKYFDALREGRAKSGE